MLLSTYCMQELLMIVCLIIITALWNILTFKQPSGAGCVFQGWPQPVSNPIFFFKLSDCDTVCIEREALHFLLFKLGDLL